MKKLLAIIISISIICLPVAAFSGSIEFYNSADLGYNISMFLYLVNHPEVYPVLEVDYNMSRSLSNNYVSVDLGKGEISMILTINPVNRKVCKIDLSIQKTDLKDNAAAYGYAIGSICSVLGFDSEELQSIMKTLGLSDDSTYEKDAFNSEYRSNGLVFKLEVSGKYISYVHFNIALISPPIEREYSVDESSCKAVITAFSSIPTFSSYIVYSAETDKNKTMGYSDSYGSKFNFNDSELSKSDEYNVQNGGSVEIFYNTADAIARYTKLQTTSYFMQELAEYSFTYKNCVLRLSCDLSANAISDYVSKFIITCDSMFGA